MIRRFKALGLALVAIFAMGVMAASSASATDRLSAPPEPQGAILTGTSHNNIYAIANGPKFECTTSKFSATAEGNAEEVTVLPSYTGTKNVTPHTNHCTASTGNVTIDTNGCHYLMTGDTSGKDEENTDATVWIQCGAKPIEITSSLGPVVKVPSQTPTQGGVVYANLPEHPGGSAIRVTSTTTGITFTCAPAFTCGLAGIPTHGNNSSYTGTVDVTGYEDNGGEFSEGEQIDVEVT